MPYIAHLWPSLTPDRTPHAKAAPRPETVEMFELVFSKREREDLERSIAAVGRRRALRLVGDAKRDGLQRAVGGLLGA